MSLNKLSKYLIIFLFSVLVVLSILLGIIVAENKTLAKDNTRLTEMVALRDKAINEIDLNIKALQEQVSKAESICNDRIKARENVLQFLNIKPPKNNGGSFSPTVIKNNLNNETNWAGNSKAVPRPNHPRFQGQVPQKCDSATLDLNNKVVSYEKSTVAINYINDYWGMFIPQSSNR